ncbi:MULTISPECIES: hypothetical protein [Psychrilyobacter]|uniref:Uncharacterized protein n=1 Tax=Psychrilyobacter piezotolerans TaxID=2293438 RepID=A0ABX9KDN8_9FUSO|nr:MULTISPECIES: hypothetical protein [Psychrilyobacter]MCS5422374.1 hypothetical protein [Psychrilyobacter sp. S5]NDI79107.1 hypothetical protein [Psychrilyobacter piezotolerans]RDE58981.1 hypothetical protein DV867_14420 [Psychrilyobacter sp. S5]REI39548.1 hypothetical protein DYH56_14420 [Psychrilyobacter piezotolerans]
MKVLDEDDFKRDEFKIKFVGEIDNFFILNSMLEDLKISSKDEKELILNVFFRRSKKLLDRLVDIIDLLKGNYSFEIYSSDYKFKFVDFYGEAVFDPEDRKYTGKFIIDDGYKIHEISRFEKVL